MVVDVFMLLCLSFASVYWYSLLCCFFFLSCLPNSRSHMQFHGCFTYSTWMVSHDDNSQTQYLYVCTLCCVSILVFFFKFCSSFSLSLNDFVFFFSPFFLFFFISSNVLLFVYSVLFWFLSAGFFLSIIYSSIALPTS